MRWPSTCILSLSCLLFILHGYLNAKLSIVHFFFASPSLNVTNKILNFKKFPLKYLFPKITLLIKLGSHNSSSFLGLLSLKFNVHNLIPFVHRGTSPRRLLNWVGHHSYMNWSFFTYCYLILAFIPMMSCFSILKTSNTLLPTISWMIYTIVIALLFRVITLLWSLTDFSLRLFIEISKALFFFYFA